MIDQQIEHYLDQFLDKDYGTETFAEWAGKQLAVEFDARDFRGMDFAAAETLGPRPGRADGRRPGAGSPGREPARRKKRPSEWNWEALAKMVNTRWHLSLRDRDLKQTRPRPGRANSSSSRPARRSQKIDLARGPRVPRSPISACRPPAAGCGTSSASNWRRTRSASWSRPAFKTAGPREGRGRLRGEGDRIPGDGRAVPLHHPRRRRPQALRPRRTGRSGPRSGSRSSLEHGGPRRTSSATRSAPC